jgi:hypothetical protein
VYPLLLAVVVSSWSPTAVAVADGTPLSVIARQSVFGSSIGVGNTLMEHDGRVNFAVRVEGSQASIPLAQVPADASVVQAFLFWGGTFDPAQGIALDRDIDVRLPDGRLINDLRVDGLQPGEPAAALTTSRCVQRAHPVGGATVPMFSCRREVTSILQGLGVGGAVGTYEVSDVELSPGDCALEPGTCEAKFGGWALAVMWQSETEPVKRDLVLADAFFALDEQNGPFGAFSSGLSPEFVIDGLTVGEDESGEITVLAWEGDGQLGVPPQNFGGQSISLQRRPLRRLRLASLQHVTNARPPARRREPRRQCDERLQQQVGRLSPWARPRHVRYRPNGLGHHPTRRHAALAASGLGRRHR